MKKRSWKLGSSYNHERFDRWSHFARRRRGSSTRRADEPRLVSTKLTFVDNYDSGAEGRGARTNHDGQLSFSFLSAF